MAIREFDYEAALRQAAALEETAAQLDALRSRRLEELTEALRAAWSGEAARRFLQECEACGEELAQESAALRDLAGRVRRAARAIQAAERRAAEQVGADQIRTL